jgi:hypothetical protein
LGVEGELNDACFVVRDADGQQIAYVENEPVAAMRQKNVIKKHF